MTDRQRMFDYLDGVAAGLNESRNDVADVLDKIRAEIERLHYHPKLDFIKNDEVVEMALDIIDKYMKESSDADSD